MYIVSVVLDVPLAQTFDYWLNNVPDSIIGRRVSVPFGRANRCQVGIVLAVRVWEEAMPPALKPVAEIFTDMPALSETSLALWQFVAQYYFVPLGQVMALALPAPLRQATPFTLTPPRIERWCLSATGQVALLALRPAKHPRTDAFIAWCLAQTSWSEREARTQFSRAKHYLTAWQTAHYLQPYIAPAQPQPSLNAAQQAAVSAVESCFGQFKTFLLHGITGSGKTAVYFKWVASLQARGQQVLILVPEIALTPQLEARFRAALPAASLAVLHSGIPETARTRAWLMAQAGTVDVVLGTRLAVFTPLPRLGLIIVDEEHDPSLRQQEGVRYSARDLAVWRASTSACPVVLGSATPSLESYAHAQRGHYHYLSLPHRAVTGASIPRFVCLDMRPLAADTVIHPQLQLALQTRLTRQEQSLLFLNRRGFAPTLFCPACAWTQACPHCSVKMVVHLRAQRLQCHHCGHQQPIPTYCPDCGQGDLLPLGQGTQRLEAAVYAAFPQARICRIDRDSIRHRGDWEAFLHAMHAGEIDIVLGTQMLAKGHDFPRLTLVGVLDSDAALFSADFRAEERLLAQLLQVAGRAGRHAQAGEVWLQTHCPQHPLFAAVAKHDYTGYAHLLLQQRQQAHLPPYAYQAILRADAPDMTRVMTFLTQAQQAGTHFPANVQVFDPIPATVMRRVGRYHGQLLLESEHRASLHAALRQWLTTLPALAPRDVHWVFDIDPTAS